MPQRPPAAHFGSDETGCAPSEKEHLRPHLGFDIVILIVIFCYPGGVVLYGSDPDSPNSEPTSAFTLCTPLINDNHL